MTPPLPHHSENARVVRLATGPAEALPDPAHPDRTWSTAFRKHARTGPVWLGYQGFQGDEQADRKNHGGVDKAVCVYAATHYPGWREELGLPEFALGAFGENLTVEGLDEMNVCVGDVFELGGAQVQVSQPRQPCWKLARNARVDDLAARVESTGRTGFYLRVLRHGPVSTGDVLTRLDRPHPDWTIARCNHVQYRTRDDREAARDLASCPALSGSWKDRLWVRAASKA
jgi:MOSC domain-containing protein YiiM